MIIDASRKLCAGTACLAVLLATPAQSHACGFDGVMGNNFGALHPLSIQVAFAIRDAVEDGHMPASVLDPITPGSDGYWRALGRLKHVHKLLSVTRPDTLEAPSLAILFIDSSLWTRFYPSAGKLRAAVHTAGPEAGDIEIISSEAIVAELLARRMPVSQALESGLIRIHAGNSTAATEWLQAAFDLDAQQQAALEVDHSAFPLFGKSIVRFQ